jgi:hypothetical protein
MRPFEYEAVFVLAGMTVRRGDQGVGRDRVLSEKPPPQVRIDP